jgi:hypothetical protein
MTKSLQSLLAALVLLIAPLAAYSQGSELYGSGIRLNINEDGSKYVRFITWHQFWTRYIDNNPGTLVNGEPEAGTTDIGLRRSRFLWYTQISPKFLILAHIGINNQTFVNGGGSGTAGTGGYGVGKKPQVFLHDMWTEYQVVKGKLYLGTGLHYWNGISRASSASTLNFLAMDAPIFNWPLIEESDQFARQFGIYAKGKIGKIDYRIAANKPFATPINVPAGVANADAFLQANPNRAFSSINNAWASAGYLAYEFFDKESNVLPFFVGTYLGSKKVFNIGAGWHYHPQATRSFNAGTNSFDTHDMKLFGVDAFLDLPLNKDKGTALTAYAVYYNYDFGPNYIRAIGIMNEGTPNPAAGALRQGGGNADWRLGTGQIGYVEAGYLLPKNLLGDKGKLQPFGSLTYQDFEYLGEPALNYSVGFNYLIEGHHAKISLKYQTRSLYNGDVNLVSGERLTLNSNSDVAGGSKRAGELILQTMIFL